LIPALVILALGADPTWALVLSQVVLSFGIGFAVVPLARYSGRRDLMGVHADGPVMKLASWVTVVLIIGLNLALLLLSI
jgi:manganese transport protein